MSEDRQARRRKSPSYPRVALERAIEMTGRIYESALDRPIDTETVINLLGFQGSNNGAARAAIASLKQFGLLDGRDEAVRVTALATQIMHPMSEDEKAKAIVTAANTPHFYSQLAAHFGGKLPSDQVLKAYLVRTHDFGISGSELLVRILRDSQSFASRYAHVDHIRNTENVRATSLDDDVSETRQFSDQGRGSFISKTPSQMNSSNREHRGEQLVFRLDPQVPSYHPL